MNAERLTGVLFDIISVRSYRLHELVLFWHTAFGSLSVISCAFTCDALTGGRPRGQDAFLLGLVERALLDSIVVLSDGARLAFCHRCRLLRL